MASMMVTLVDYMAKSLVDEPDEVEVSERDEGDRMPSGGAGGEADEDGEE